MTGPNRGKALAYTMALFIAGGICGAMVMVRFFPVTQPLKLGRTEEITTNIREKMKTRLGLAPEQLEKFQPLISKTAVELESSHRDCLERISVALDSLHAQITPELNAEQKQKMTALETERRDLMLQKYNFQPAGMTRTNK